MKANGPKRKIFDAVDMLTEESSAQVQDQAADGVQMLPLDNIKAGNDFFYKVVGNKPILIRGLKTDARIL